MALSRSWATTICALCALAVNVKGHTYISYPGWRGNNLGITDEYPFGMQRGYPCECHSYFFTLICYVYSTCIVQLHIIILTKSSLGFDALQGREEGCEGK